MRYPFSPALEHSADSIGSGDKKRVHDLRLPYPHLSNDILMPGIDEVLLTSCIMHVFKFLFFLAPTLTWAQGGGAADMVNFPPTYNQVPLVRMKTWPNTCYTADNNTCTGIVHNSDE